jgi:hypothetical protein
MLSTVLPVFIPIKTLQKKNMDRIRNIQGCILKLLARKLLSSESATGISFENAASIACDALSG